MPVQDPCPLEWTGSRIPGDGTEGDRAEILAQLDVEGDEDAEER
jgi:hypothetical protein